MKKSVHSGRPRMSGTDLILGAVVVALLISAVMMQRARFAPMQWKQELYYQRIKLPPADVLRLITLGYDNIYADYLWLQSIQNFGSGWITEDRSTKPIYDYFDTITDVDPHFPAVYRFANLVIGDNRQDWKLGQEILRKGVHKNPMNYDIPYLGMYNGIFMYNGKNDARWFARRLRRIPDAPGFMKRMEEYIERSSGRFEAAFEMNVRYYLEALAANNEVELGIIERRVQDVVDKAARKRLRDAAVKYLERNGRHPERMEDLLTTDYLPPQPTFSLSAFHAALENHQTEVERLSGDKPIPDDLVRTITQESQPLVAGLPPEPTGSWYLIYQPERELFITGGEDVAEHQESLPYIRSARELLDISNANSFRAQQFIMSYMDKNGRLPNDEEMRPFYGRDPLGGYYVYQREAPESPKYGVFYSTTTKKILENREPRMGISGLGPFPFSIAGDLTETMDGYLWGLRNGFISLDGTQRWFRAFEEPEEFKEARKRAREKSASSEGDSAAATER